MPLKLQFNKKTIHLLGVMSGTSCDGIDLALIEMNIARPDYQDIHVVKSMFFPYPKEIKKTLNELITKQEIAFSVFADLERALTILHADAINEFRKKSETIDLIGVHGQTLYHRPPKKKELGYSWQLVSHEQLAKLVEIPCVGDFRNGDMALGGHGAPLISYFDYLMFYKAKTSQLILNIGGISNGTFLPKSGDEKKIIAGDFGPGNTLIDQACLRLFNKQFDKNGDLAKKGKIDTSLIISWIIETPYFHESFPKSTGRELFSKSYLDKLLEDCERKELSKHSALATISALTVSCIKSQFQRNIDEIMLTGGGAKNEFLRGLIQNEIGNVIYVNNQMIDFKEAIGFALLAFHYLLQKPSSFPNTSGAKNPTVLGSLAWA